MEKIIIGIDPDSKAHGVATYVDGNLEMLESLTLLKVKEKVEKIIESSPFPCEADPHVVIIHMEDVNGVSAAFRARDGKGNIHVKLKMAQSIGMVKQSQIELERLFESLGVKVVKHKISKRWKDAQGKKEFEKATGWTGRSNEDTRSAAHFGMLGL